ncbi:MAG: pantoate--beta-alanine ligase [Magnetovibrionaceae bacterium]
MPAVVRTVEDLRAQVAAWRASGDRIALVPTMGALHEGHLDLVRAAKKVAGRVVATIFVNPKQFGEGEDFGVYPRDEAGDFAKLDGVGCDLVFAPDVTEMYATGFQTKVSLGALGDILEGAFRPGFFDGVATVVTKLLLQALPDLALFGEKDFQQLQVIKRFVADLNIPVTIQGVETRREADGLALSSRNAYLSGSEREAAPCLNRELKALAQAVLAGEPPEVAAAAGADRLLAAGFSSVDYLTVRDAETLDPWEGPGSGRPGRALGAAKLGRARLIDNIPV